MKCPECNKEMENLGPVPRMGRRVIGKQYFKMKCTGCGNVNYVKPNEVKK